jgi:alkaline phosphatase D
VFRLLIVAALAAALALPAGGAAAGFAYGVAAGEVTSSSALLWTRAPAAGPVRVEVSTRRDFAGLPIVKTGVALSANDATVTIPVSGLKPATRYVYRFRAASAVSLVGTFTTAPAPGADARVRFAITGDADASPGTNGKPAFNGFETYARMAAERNDFNVNLGDTIYSDSGVGGARVARTTVEKWGKYRLGLALAPLQRLRAAAGLYSHWDDHEFVNDFSRAEHGEAIYRAGVKAFRDYAPVTYRPATGLFRTVRWGRNLELFFLDERSFRSAKVARECGSDLAPTAPQAVRLGFATIAPALAQPVAQACLDALASPSRTMLGAAQWRAFEQALRASTATWKVVVNEVPLLELVALPYDRWEGYAADRARMVALLASVRNAVVLTTDTHAHLIGEVRTGTLTAAPQASGVWEVVTGPVATNTYAREIDRYLGSQGAGTFVTSLFFKPAPPRGLGLTCAATDVYGYSQVTVTRSTLTVQPKAAAGGIVREATGSACGPLVLRAR